jgi:RNA recognition motif-containing protein
MILVDSENRRSRQFAFVDFDSAEAAKLVAEKWDRSCMNKYPNRLHVQPYDTEHHKMTQAEREKSRGRGAHTNLFVENLPPVFTESHVLNLFKRHGMVTSVKVKKPQLPGIFSESLLIPSQGYVNFKTEQEAKAAIEALNGKSVLPGSAPLRI